MAHRDPTRLLAAILVAALVPLAACKKKEEQPAQNGQPGAPGIQINAGPGSGVMAAPGSTVERYSDEGPEIGTTTIKRPSIARKSADQASEIIGRIGVGTAVNKKARKGPYYLIEFPSAPGQMSLGWVVQDDILGSTVPVPTPTPTVTVPPPATTTVAPTNGRPPLLRLPSKK